MNFDATMWSIIAPALVVSLLVAMTHVPLGQEVLKRGIIFIDLATAQIAGLGAVAMTIYLPDPHSMSGFIWVNFAAFSAALLSGLFFSWAERNLKNRQEALIGCSFVLAASLAILILANQPMGGDEIKDLLAGQILWVTWSKIAMVALIYIPLLLIWFGMREKLGHAGFYMIFAIAVTTSVQIVGVYLVFAFLIFPTLGASSLSKSKRLVAAYSLAFMGIFLGLILSVITDWPTGPTLVWTLALIALTGAICLPKIVERKNAVKVN